MLIYCANSYRPYIPPRAGWASGRNGTERDMNASPHHTRQGSRDNYYEDVEPRFAEDVDIGPTGSNNVPSVLMAGKKPGEIQPPPPLKIHGENVGEGPGSPAVSDISQGSHFTSISERPINPNWQGQAPAPAPARGPRMQDMVLQANPDFELPVAGRGRGGGARYGRGGRMTPVIENSGRYPS